MNNKKTRLAAFGLAALIAVSAAIPASAAGMDTESTSTISERSLEREYKFLGGLKSKYLSYYQRTSIKIGNEVLNVKGFRDGDIDYIPLRTAANAIGASYKYDPSAKAAEIAAPGLVFTIGAGCYVGYANGRVLFSDAPCTIMNDGRMYVNAETFAKATGYKLSRGASSVSFTGSYSPIISADRFYRQDEVFWLARIINAESAGEPLIGKIAVGNVVLNRTKSPEYPNTIYGVIFDRKYGVQFSPILNGSIYNTPSYNSTLAAKICLEGYDVSEGALFFLEPRLSSSSWIPKNRDYLFTIDSHDFYK